MRRRVALAVSMCVAAAVPAAAPGRAWAQASDAEPATVAPAQWRPVDATVSDVDPRAASQRQAHMGIGAFTPVHRMRTRLDPDATPGEPANLDPIDPATGLNLPQPYRYQAPGVHARLQRPSYLTVVDPGRQDILYQGEGSRERPYVAMNRQPLLEPLFVELIPANTVFELTPQTVAPADPAPSEGWVDRRIDGRVGATDPARWSVHGQRDGRRNARRIDDLAPADRYAGLPLHESIARTARDPSRDDAAARPETDGDADAK